VSFGGLVTDVYDGLTKKGRPFMSFTIEDYNGGLKVMLFDKDYEAYSKLIKKNSSLYIKAHVEERRFPDKDGNRPLELHITTIKLLSNIRDEFIKKITINVNLQDLNKVNIDLIKNALTTKGDVALYFTLVDAETKLTLNLLSHKMSVKISDELVEFLANNSEIVSFTLNNGQKPRKRIEEQQPESDNNLDDEMSADQMDGEDD